MVAAPFDTPSMQRVERWTRARRAIAETLGAWAANATAHDVRMTTPRSKRRGSPYRAGRADCWIKVKTLPRLRSRAKPKKIRMARQIENPE